MNTWQNVWIQSKILSFDVADDSRRLEYLKIDISISTQIL